jgi:hypothetical protein
MAFAFPLSTFSMENSIALTGAMSCSITMIGNVRTKQRVHNAMIVTVRPINGLVAMVSVFAIDFTFKSHAKSDTNVEVREINTSFAKRIVPLENGLSRAEDV